MTTVECDLTKSDVPANQGEFVKGMWAWLFGVHIKEGNFGVPETELALRAFRYHTRDKHVDLHIWNGSPEHELLYSIIRSFEPDVYLDSKRLLGKAGCIEALMPTVRAEYTVFAHCDTIILADDIFSWPSAIFLQAPPIQILFEMFSFRTFVRENFRFLRCYSSFMCLRSSLLPSLPRLRTKSGWRFPVGEITFEGTLEHPYAHSPTQIYEHPDYILLHTWRTFGVESTFPLPPGFYHEFRPPKPELPKPEPKILHFNRAYPPPKLWQEITKATAKDRWVPRQHFLLQLLNKYRELTPDIKAHSYSFPDGKGGMYEL